MAARTRSIMSITTERNQPMTMKNPPHPGVVVLQECIEPSGLTITRAAAALGVTRNTLSELVNAKRGISPEMAVRLAKVFRSAGMHRAFGPDHHEGSRSPWSDAQHALGTRQCEARHIS